MRTVSDVMTRGVRTIAPKESIQRAAQMMDELNVGVLPVCDGERLVGMITDRDITVRAISAGESPKDAPVENFMSSDVRWCFDDEPLDEVMKQMGDVQIRRVPVVNHDKKLVGIVALGDIATKIGVDVEDTLQDISTPSKPETPDRPSLDS
jgi:CBS domain-containing protein